LNSAGENTLTQAASPVFPPDATVLRTSSGPAWVVHSAKDIPESMRGGAFAMRAKDFRYYEMVEASLAEQFEFHYFILRDDAMDAWAVQPFFFVDQDLLAGLPAGIRSLFNGVRKIWPRFLKLRMMTIGCAAGEGELDHDQPWVAAALYDAIEGYRRAAKAFLILLKDYPAGYRTALANFTRGGYERVPSMPAAELALDFASFEEFMAKRLSKVFRKNLRRKLRASEEGPAVTMETLKDVTPIVDEILPLYLQTHERSEFKFEKLTREYFCLLGQRMPDRVQYFVWRREGRIIAFSLCMLHEDMIDDVNVGMDYSVALELSLYFRTWRDIIGWAVGNGYKLYHTGPLDYDPKLHLKLHLAPLDLYSRHNSSLINPIYKLAMKYLEPTRHDKVIRKFPNAQELYG
jgi:hypothetical protein